MKRVILAGGSGFVGRFLVRHFQELGFEVVVFSRSGGEMEGARVVRWDGKSAGDWCRELEGAEVVVNLCGAPIDKKWTDSYKVVLRRSRVEPSLAIGHAIAECADPPKLWINFSAVGIYGDRGDSSLSEASPVGSGFMADLAKEWESACLEFELPKTRQIVARLGVVLGRDGGAYPLLKKLTESFLGGAVGSGNQYMSWVHIDDIGGIINEMLEKDMTGPVNIVSPNPVSNSEFMRQMRLQFDKPMVPSVPAFAMKAMSGLIGLEGTVLLEGQRVYPVVAESWGYQFSFARLSEAIENLER